MSLILEALRKSEAERRRGQAPDLHNELPPTARLARSRRPAWPWLLAVAIIAAVAALATTWLARGPRAPTPTTVETAADDRAPFQGVPGESVPEQLSEPLRTSPPAPSTAAPAEPATPSSPVAPTIAPTEPASTPGRQPEPEPHAPPVRDIDGSRAAAIATPPPPTATPVPASPPATTATPATPQATATAVDKRAPVRLADLPAAERRALPPLEISMHMWAPTAAGRFVIIDGTRFNEGDRLGDAVVDEITRDGVVLAWHGRRVAVPIQ